MFKATLVLLLVTVSLSAAIKFRADLASYFIKDVKTAEIEGAASPDTYAGMVVLNDDEIKRIVEEVSTDCRRDDKACVLYELHKWLVEDFNYIEDPSGLNIISGVSITLRKKGGDCEDLSILLASMLENAGISTKLALQDDHVYLYACGVPKNGVFRMMKQDPRFKGYALHSGLIEEYTINSETCIPVDPSIRSKLAFPGVKPSGEDRFIVSNYH